MAELAGVMVGNYFLLECLSREGMVETYRARPTTRGGYDVMLRLYRPHFPDPTGFHDAFALEVEKVWRCHHPHIQSLLEYGAGEDLLYSVSQEAEETLETMLKREYDRVLPLPQVMHFVTQLCAALQYAHERDIVHGNIQPSSILIRKGEQDEDEEDGEDIVLTNFSMRRAYRDGDPLMSEIEMGNPAYMAPEQSLGIVRQASDIYAVGVLLFRLLTGRLPYEGESAQEIAMKHTDEPIPSLRALCPDLPEELELVVRVALSKSSEARFPTAAALAEALISAIVPGAPQVVTDSPQRRVAVRSRRTHFSWARMASMLTLGVLLFGLFGASFFVFSQPQPFRNLSKFPFWHYGYTATPGGTASTIPGTAPPPGSGLTPTPGSTHAGSGPGGKATPPASTFKNPTPGATVGSTPTVGPGTPTPTSIPSTFTCASGMLSLATTPNLTPLLQQVNSSYQSACPGMSISMGASIDRRALNQVQQNQVGIAVSELSALPRRGLTDHPFAASLYAIIVSPDVQVSGLSSAQIQAIYTGKITNWSQVGGRNEAITVILHPATNAINAIFRTYVLNGAAIHVKHAVRLMQDSPDLAVQAVNQVPAAISIVPLVAARGSNVQVLAIDGVSPSTQSLQAGAYPFWSIEHLYTRGPGTVQAQSYLQFAGSTQEAGGMSQFGAVPVSAIPQTVLASHLPGPEI